MTVASSPLLGQPIFARFFKASRQAVTVTDAERELIHIAVSLSLHCEPCATNHIGIASRMGISAPLVDSAVLTGARVSAEATARSADPYFASALRVDGLPGFKSEVERLEGPNESTNILVGVAVAAALCHGPQLEHEIVSARDRGVSDELMSEAISIGCSVSAGVQVAMADRSRRAAEGNYRYWEPRA